jgi:glyoxylase-like metal-dependent hydrolase (beta-lactamase superfamily II)
MNYHHLLYIHIKIDSDNIPGVHHLGYHSVESYGATPYLIVRAAAVGNVMIDSPRFNERLAKSIEQLGGLRFIILTHKDDVADHEK